MKCFYCGEDIREYWKGDQLKNTDGTTISLNKPNTILWFHRECLEIPDLEQYLNDNVEKIHDLCYNSGGKSGRNERNWYSKRN